MMQTAAKTTGHAELEALADDAVALVRTWLEESREVPTDAAAQRLAGVLGDPTSRSASSTASCVRKT
jgi:RHH-type proline utilization regulon transcriptional repressor/proline dehydrogenase/delta 1-pyrroline-5-carboxylate dehydrogenase